MNAACLLAALLTSIAFSAQAATAVIETRFSEQCALASNEPALRVFDDAASWQAFNTQVPLPGFNKTPDWHRQRVLVFTVGMRPTPGYSLTLKASRLRRCDQTLLLDVAEQRPPADAFLPQVLTQPCLIMLVRKTGWQTIQLRDVDNERVLVNNSP